MEGIILLQYATLFVPWGVCIQLAIPSPELGAGA